ncbi:MAG: hypothetical protein ISS64_02375, partial [Desulfobacterales bacterium]|nr:hypothetical protein [Desulfobacterales bacterium]
MTNTLEFKSSFINNSEKKTALDTEGRDLLARPRFSLRLHLLLVFILFSFLSMAIIIGSVIAISSIDKKMHFVQTSERYLFEIAQARRWEKNYFLYDTNLEDAVQSAGNAKTFLSQNLKKFITVLSAEETAGMIEHLEKYRSLLQDL